MAQQAPLEPGSALYELATYDKRNQMMINMLTVPRSADLSKVPEKLVCKNCSHFLLNAFKTACCDGALCESCMTPPPVCVDVTDHPSGNTAAAGGACPLCKHEPLLSNASKALRGTARNYLKSALANAEKSTEPTPSREKENVPSQAPETPAEVAPNGTPGTHATEEQSQPEEKVENTQAQAVDELLEPSAEVVQSIEVGPWPIRRKRVLMTRRNRKSPLGETPWTRPRATNPTMKT